LPRALDKALAALGLPIAKDKEGQRLVRSLSRPNRTGAYPEITTLIDERVAAYNQIDIAALEAMMKQGLGRLDPAERKVWLLDQKINARGIAIDVGFVEAAKRISDQVMGEAIEEFKALTGGLSPHQVQRIREWLRDNHCALPNLEAETIEEALESEGLPANVRRVLEIRQIAAAASLKKLDAMLACVGPDGRARGLLQYHGATTGRWSGQLIQPQNFPRPTIEAAAVVETKRQPRALDLYCGAGGVTRGLQQAGFHVTGVDIIPQPRYCGDAFAQMDALEYLKTADLSQFDYIAASPPCQRYTSIRHAPGKHRDADLVDLAREALIKIGKPYVIENVPGAPLIDPITLSGSMFGLGAEGWRIERKRLFEASFPIAVPPRQEDDRPVVGIYGGHFRDRRRGKGENHRSDSNVPSELGYQAMGIPFGSMTTAEISDAIPPAYSKFIAEQWLQQQGKASSEAPSRTVAVDPEELVAAVKTEDPEALRRWGKPVDVLVSGLRHALTAADEAMLGAGDFSMIEACVLLALAGQHDKCKLIAEGADIYRDMAATIYGLDREAFMAIPEDQLSPEEVEQRRIGKNGVLSCGFGVGAEGFYRRFCRHVEDGRTLAAKIIGVYRNVWAPAVPRLWRDLEQAARLAMLRSGQPAVARCNVVYRLTTRAGLPCLTCVLPSGKLLHYVNARIDGQDKWGRPRWIYNAYKQGHWATIEPYGGQLTENVVSALARELLVHAMFALEAAGYPIVFTVHDEIVVERADVAKEAIERIMSERPEWSVKLGVPVKAKAWVGKRYRK
jgi:DNA (cytosine-5)-methyltransferase 1